jgi:hypothetical protein
VTTHICDLSPSGGEPESARSLLYRHGLPEDIVDGALCLHAQELAAVQRLRMDELDLAGQKARIVGRIVDLIDPTKTAAAGPAPATDQAARRDRYAQALLGPDAAGTLDAAADEMLNAVLAVADAEQAGLHARIAELESSCRDVDRLRRDWVEMRDRAEALDVRVQALTTAVLPASTGRADVLREAADRLDTMLAQLFPAWPTEPKHSPGVRSWREATAELRRMADETPQPETVHGCPPDGSGLTPCCGRTPFELPLGDRISSEATVTCQGAPAAVAQPDEEA